MDLLPEDFSSTNPISLVIDPALTDPVQVEKLRRYWALGPEGWKYRQKDLYDAATPTSLKLHQFASRFSKVQIPGKGCARCHSLFVFKTRGEVDSYRPAGTYCAACQAIRIEEWDRAENERIKREALERQARMAAITASALEACQGFVPADALDKLDVQPLVAFLSLLELREEEPRVVRFQGKHSPSRSWTYSLVKELVELRLLAPIWDDRLWINGEPPGENRFDDLSYQIRVAPDFCVEDFRRRKVAELRASWSSGGASREPLTAFVRVLCRWEAAAFLLEQFEQRGIDGFNPGGGTMQAIDAALQHYTLGQVWNLMFQGAAHAGDQIAKGVVSRSHAASRGVAQINRRMMYALADQRQLRQFTRNTDRMRLSAISRLVFAEICCTSDEGFCPGRCEVPSGGSPP